MQIFIKILQADDAHFIGQKQVYQDLGVEMLEHSFEGWVLIFVESNEDIRNNCFSYNVCIFAYGQTGGGKSFTMMGKPNDEEMQGIVPRLCQELFQRIKQYKDPHLQFTVEVWFYFFFDFTNHILQYYYNI